MGTHVAFVRAINVRGHPTLRTAELARAFAAAGGRDVRTVAQSGNVVYDIAGRAEQALARRAREALGRKAGDGIVIVTRSVNELRGIVEHAPFGALERDRLIKLSVAFLAKRPKRIPQLPLSSMSEQLTLVAVSGRNAYVVSRRKPNGFYGFPNNFVEEALVVTATTRNWSTIKRVLAIVASRECNP